MAADFQTLLSNRLEEIDRQLPAARAEVVRLEKERGDILKAAEATGITLLDNKDRKEAEGFIISPMKKSEQQTHYTMKDATTEILEGLPKGLTANQIREIMKEKFGLKYARSSLSPQLSRLKADGFITSVEGRWVLSKYMIHTEDNA